MGVIVAERGARGTDMTLRTQLADWLAPQRVQETLKLEKELEKTRSDAIAMTSALATFGDILRDTVSGVPLVPSEIASKLTEGGVDEVILQQLIYQLGYDQLSSLSSTVDESGQEREALVKQARTMFKYSPLVQFSIWLWTGWGLGDRITITLENDQAQKIWDEFWTAERNESIFGADQIHELSDWLLVNGNRFVALFTATSGENAGQTTARILDQDEVTPIANPEDRLDVWFYKRAVTTTTGIGGDTYYYPDYKTAMGDGGLLEKRWATLLQKKVVSDRDKRADKLKAGTTVCIFHVAHNQKDEKSPLGWPLTTTSGAWVRGHKQFSEARLGVAMAIAQFVRRSKVQGGSRAVKSVIAQVASTLSRNNYLDRNPPGAAGSTHVENSAVDTEELPMRTGASDAKDDNAMFSWMALLGMGLFPTSAGLDTSRWATAVEMDKAQSMIFERYQRFWTAQFKKLVRIVLMLESKYGAVKLTVEKTIADISTDSFSLSDYPAVSKSVADQVDKMLTPYVEKGLIKDDTARQLLAMLWRMSTDALGSGVSRDLTTPEAFGVGDEEEAPDNSEPAVGDEEDEVEPGMEELQGRQFAQALRSLQLGETTPAQFAEWAFEVVGDAIAS